MGSRIVLLGPPGSGKGTQGARLAAALGVPQISTGDLLRQADRTGSALGRLAHEYMKSGRLVPDEVMLGLIREVLENSGRRGFVLDGFPRTIAQAEGLDAMLATLDTGIERAVALDVDEPVLVARLSARLVCESCGTNAARNGDGGGSDGTGPTVCALCGGRLVQREDDSAETVRRRLAVYREQTEPLLDYYARQGKLVRIDGDQSVDAVFTSLVAAMENEVGGR